MLSSVEAWWVGLCALPLDGAQDDSHAFVILLICYYSCKWDADLHRHDQLLYFFQIPVLITLAIS